MHFFFSQNIIILIAKSVLQKKKSTAVCISITSWQGFATKKKKMSASLMEVSVRRGFRTVSGISFLTHFSSKPVFLSSFFGPKSFCCKRLSYNSRSLVKFSMSMEKQSSSLNGYGNYMQENIGVVEVIAIGSRKDAVLEFCLDSPFQSSSLRFW